MKVLLLNKFYYPKGGDSIHAMSLEKLLRSRGHEVAFFAQQGKMNETSAYAAYFPSEVDYTYRNYKNIKEQLLRPLGSNEVVRKFRALLDHFKPDIIHAHSIHSQLSPVIVKEAHKKGIPVVWSLHDYKILCPRYDFRRDDKPCELCVKDKKNVILHRCMKNSLPVSILAYIEARIWNIRKLSRYTQVFVCPSEFLRNKMIGGGVPEDQLITLNNFFETRNYTVAEGPKDGYYCYVGRLSKEKGIETLLKAAMELPGFHLKVIGTGPLSEYFLERYSAENIQYYGHRSSEEVQNLLSKAAFSVMPSECYENNPLAVIESLCCGTPVLGARTGGIPELITEGENGYLFESGNLNDLKRMIGYFFNHGKSSINPERIAEMAKKRFSSETFCNALLDIYQTAINNHS